MAKQDDIVDKVINVALFVAVAVGLFYAYKWLKNHAAGLSGNLFGGTSPAQGSGLGNQAGSDIGAALGSVGQKIAGGFAISMGQPGKITRMAYELSLANSQAKRYWNKAGSNIVINKTLKAVNHLSDAEFMQVVNEWMKVDHISDFYKSTLVGAQIYTPAHSEFLVRYEKLTGAIKG